MAINDQISDGTFAVVFSAAGLSVVVDLLPAGVIAAICEDIRRREKLRLRLLANTDTSSLRNEIYIELSQFRETILRDEVDYIGLGSFYDVYRIGSSRVVKVGRADSDLAFPAILTRGEPEHWSQLVTSAQADVLAPLSGMRYFDAAAFRTIVSWRFYVDTLCPTLPGRVAETQFAVLGYEERAFEVQIQPYYEGPTLGSLLRRSDPWAFVSLHFTLKSGLGKTLKWIPESLDPFIAQASIDHKPDNFIVQSDAQRLILVDIQEIPAETEQHNLSMLEAVRAALHYQRENPGALRIVAGVRMFLLIVALPSCPFILRKRHIGRGEFSDWILLAFSILLTLSFSRSVARTVMNRREMRRRSHKYLSR